MRWYRRQHGPPLAAISPAGDRVAQSAPSPVSLIRSDRDLRQRSRRLCRLCRIHALLPDPQLSRQWPIGFNMQVAAPGALSKPHFGHTRGKRPSNAATEPLLAKPPACAAALPRHAHPAGLVRCAGHPRPALPHPARSRSSHPASRNGPGPAPRHRRRT